MLKDQIKKDQIAAMKSGDQLRRTTLGTLLSVIKNRELVKRGQLSKTISDEAKLEQESQLTDDEAVEAISSEVKKRKDAMEQFSAANRQDLADKEKEEKNILLTYLPQQLSEEEIKAEIAVLIKELGVTDIKDMGRVIKEAMAKLKGRVDGGRLSQIVKQALL